VRTGAGPGGERVRRGTPGVLTKGQLGGGNTSGVGKGKRAGETPGLVLKPGKEGREATKVPFGQSGKLAVWPAPGLGGDPGSGGGREKNFGRKQSRTGVAALQIVLFGPSSA